MSLRYHKHGEVKAFQLLPLFFPSVHAFFTVAQNKLYTHLTLAFPLMHGLLSHDLLTNDQ